jgi:cytochrome c-type biogenesis protein CcmE
MKISPNTIRIGIAVAIVVATIAWLAWSGYGANKSYYVTIPELGGMGDKAYHSQLRVEGFVKPGSIEQNGTHVTFVMNEFESHSPKAATGRVLTVNYKGAEPPPDTFKDDSQALAEGTYGRDGVFHATVLQAKCASKYAPSGPNGQPGMTPAKPGSTPAQPAAHSHTAAAQVVAPAASNPPAAAAQSAAN